MQQNTSTSAVTHSDEARRADYLTRWRALNGEVDIDADRFLQISAAAKDRAEGWNGLIPNGFSQ